MSDTASGVVGWAGGKRFHDKTLYSFKFDGDDVFYRCGEVDPQVSRGEGISFTYKKDGKGNSVVDVASIKREEAPTKEEPKAQGAAGKSNPYHEREDAKQRIIMYQSATKTAVEIAVAAVENDMLQLGAKNKKLDNFKEVIDKLTDELVVKFINAPAHTDELLGVTAPEIKGADKVDGGMSDD